jgi:hypothetical protein
MSRKPLPVALLCDRRRRFMTSARVCHTSKSLEETAALCAEDRTPMIVHCWRRRRSGGETLKFFSRYNSRSTGPFGSVGMTTSRRRAVSIISPYDSKAFNCASAICAAGKFPSSIAVLSPSRWRERFDSARERHHVPNTFKAQGDHFQGLREPFSQPKFHSLHSPANGHRRVRVRDRKMDTAAIAITTCVGLYLALRVTLRCYFPPDT